MKELIKKLLEKWSCKHTWTIHFRASLMEFGNKIGIRDTLICNNCGKIKKINL